ncbi:MAG: hypothetical protein ABI867_02335 [Kofleriaceae bacterium]
MRTRWVAAAVVAAIGCKDKRDRKADDPMPMPEPAPVVHVDAPKPWPELEGYTITAAERVVALPVKPDTPRFDVGGPVVAGDVAVVASSQFGFVAVDWRRGAIAWSKPAGLHVAPPLYADGHVILVGDCLAPPAIPDGEVLVGCIRVVTPTGTDEAYSAIRARPKAIATFADARGEQALWRDDDHTVRWRRGDAAIAIDLVTGAAKPADATPPPLVVEYKTHRWEVAQVDGRIVAREHGKIAWETQHPYTRLLGTVWLPGQSPMVRLVNVGSFRGDPEINLMDMDATGSLRGQVAKPAPGIALISGAVSSIGDAAIAVRLDTSLRRDFVVGYAANSLLMWVFPLPELPRADGVGLAIAPDAVVVFHDGDTLTILPELSAPPTTPGAARASSKNPTP